MWSVELETVETLGSLSFIIEGVESSVVDHMLSFQGQSRSTRFAGFLTTTNLGLSERLGA